MTLTDVADEIYAAPLAEFTSTRDARTHDARTSGDRVLAAEIKALRKPSATAWVVNQLVRHRSDEVQSLLDLGAQMRDAQEDLDRDTLRRLTDQRRKVVQALAKRAGTLAEDLGHRANSQTITEVEQTLQAAMTDPAAADAVRTGRLLRGLEVTGFEPVELAGAVAVDGSPATPAPATPGRSKKAETAARELDEARRKAAETEQWAGESEKELAGIDRRLADLDSTRAKLGSKHLRLTRSLAELEDELSELDDDAHALEGEREQAARAARSARRSADRARERLEYLG